MHTSGHDSFIRYMTEINVDVMTAYVRNAASPAAVDRETGLLIRMYCIGTVSLMEKTLAAMAAGEQA